MKFTSYYKDRLGVSKGLDIVENGTKLGESDPVKDSYWSVYKYEGEYFISLNDQCTDVWEADEQDAINYNENPC